MTETLQFQLDDGSTALFEVQEASSGVHRVGRSGDGLIEASSRLGDALQTVRGAAQSALDALKTLSPTTLELEFGVKLTAETGALIARTAGEGHFVVKVSWTPDEAAKGRTGDDHAAGPPAE